MMTEVPQLQGLLLDPVTRSYLGTPTFPLQGTQREGLRGGAGHEAWEGEAPGAWAPSGCLLVEHMHEQGSRTQEPS